ncbi:MAG: universal stress protein [Rhodobacter sp.]|nr:universal stress protein [Rhodobacter sp.]
MYTNILIATDGSELATRAVEHGLRLAKSVGAGVVFVTVTEIWSALDMAGDIDKGRLDAVQAYEDATSRSAEAILAEAQARAAAMDVTSEIRHIKDRVPAEGIMETAELEDCDLIVMASHGRRGLQRMLIGSQTAEVIALSKRPVLVLR